MKVVLPGGSGFVGRLVVPDLLARGDEVVVLTRGPSTTHADGARDVHWDGRTRGPWTSEVATADVVVHLAGRRVDQRPTRSAIEELVRSRVESVRAVGDAVRAAPDGPTTWVQLSTVAIHGDTGDRLIDDDTPIDGVGPPQMTGVALAWERAVDEATSGMRRRVVLRAGIAIGGPDDPATARLAGLARFGLGGPVAGGRQWVSWIAAEDMRRAVLRAIDDRSMVGTYTLTSPEPVRNERLMAAYRAAVGRARGMPSPRWATVIGAWLLGSDPALALTGRRAVPSRLLDAGFTFQHTGLEEVVADAVRAMG